MTPESVSFIIAAGSRSYLAQPSSASRVDGHPDRSYEQIAVNRLTEIVPSATTLGTSVRTQIVLTGDHYHWNVGVGTPQVTLDLPAAHLRHVHIEHHTVRLVIYDRVQELSAQ